MSQNGRKTELSPKQATAIAALLDGKTQADAAKAAGVGERTLYRWQHEAAFVAALRDAEGELIDGATRRLLRLAGPAVNVFLEVIADRSNSPGLRLRAAAAVLDNLLQLRNLRDIEERLAALEAQNGGAR